MRNGIASVKIAMQIGLHGWTVHHDRAFSRTDTFICAFGFNVIYTYCTVYDRP